ncbi:MAG TPA: cytochrome P450 [Solirubrobacteraceae bacterium]|nr:cytochrome P450 [Solirubrobacteraceae bacterium]
MLPPGPSEPAALQTLEWALRPTALLRRCARRHGEAFTLRLSFDDAPMACLWSPQAVADVFSAPPGVLRRGESPGPLRPVAGARSILLADGAEHLRMRRLMLPPFHGERLRALRGRVAARAADAAEAWPAGHPVALLGELQRVALDIALDALLGPDGDGLAAPVRATLDRVRSAPRVAAMTLVQRDLGPRSPWGAFLRDVRAVDDALGAVIARRRAGAPAGDTGTGGRPRDVLDDLLAARDSGGAPLADREVRDHVVTLLAAGHETTAGAGAWALERLARAPGWARRIRYGDDEALDAVVHETLRVRPVLTVAPRRLAEPLNAGGVDLPAGVHVAPCLYLVQRHPALWPQPAAWRPERWLGPDAARPEAPGWVPFGGGVRRCVGAAFALMELRELLRAVLARWELAPARPAGERMRRRGITLQPERGAAIVLRPSS